MSPSIYEWNRFKVTFSDLGDGWAPAVLDSQEELDLIRQGQKRNRELWSYWIGGSTAAEIDSTIKYSNYYTNGSGNHIVWQCNNMSYESGIPSKNNI